MRKFYSSFLPLLIVGVLTFSKASAQCPTGAGMLAVPVTLNGFCYVNVQFAIPNSNVSIFNASGYVADANANSSGAVVIPYPCSANPLTNVLSINASTGQFCAQSNITQQIPLPVKLIAFDGKLTAQKKVTLSWKTAYELNSERFDIEKSDDGVHFYSIGTSRTSESSFSEQSYSFEDASFVNGATAYYRLKQVDLDGKTSYSKIIYINDKATKEITAFPNPSIKGGAIFLKGVAAKDVQYSNIRVSDISGKMVSYRITGANSIQLTENITSGLYIIRINEKSIKLMVD